MTKHKTTLAIVMMILVIFALLFQLARTSTPAAVAAPVVAPVAAATYTPTPFVMPTATPVEKSVGTYVESMPVATSDLQDTLDRIASALEYLTEAEYRRAQSEYPPSTGPTVAPSNNVAVAVQPTPVPQRTLNVWEDGSCWVPDDMPVLMLCGAAESDGYVIRWRGVHGDSRGPEIPDADYMARSGVDELVWSGHHPATGEMVTVDYWAGGHVLAVKVAGKMLFRIDRNHKVQR